MKIQKSFWKKTGEELNPQHSEETPILIIDLYKLNKNE